MATGSQKRTRSERVAALDLPPSQWERTWASLGRRDVLGRVLLALLAAVAMTAVIRGWNPPLSYRLGWLPPRDIVSRVAFQKLNPDATNIAKAQAAAKVPYVYAHDPQPLVNLRGELQRTWEQVAAAPTAAEAAAVWRTATATAGEKPPEGDPPADATFAEFYAALKEPDATKKLQTAVAEALAPFEQRGLLAKPDDSVGPGNPDEVHVHPVLSAEPLQRLKLADVLLGDGKAVRQSLEARLPSPELARRAFAWLGPQLPVTLAPDHAQTRQNMKAAEAAVEPVMLKFSERQELAKAGEPLTAELLDLLRLEHDAAMAQRPLSAQLTRAGAVLAMIFALFLLCGVYMRYRQRGPLASVTRLLVMLLLALAAVSLARWMARDPWRAELIPVTLFGMTMAIVYRQEMALLLTSVVGLLIALATGYGLSGFVLLVGVATAANVSVRQIRTRRKLIYVGALAGGVAAALDVGLALLENQPLSLHLLADAAQMGLWGLAAGFVMTGLLPFIEQLFGVLTDLSLLELGDVTHPLLQELVRRAPSTYNHSLTVGSIAEAAADAIGVRGLLVRIGAYFHDIGKMLKPGYFVENQGVESSRHEGLVPAMSTLVIIAHIKDGADLARQYRLPQPIVDLIGQHHGTTLVEYFYDRANEQSQADPNGNQPDETTFRYPGPRPQTKEAAVLMLADAVESASRTLVDPAPARIESMVRTLAERRLHDGQFDESGLTLRELRTIERSLVMSLTSIYHGRIKYPEQRTA